MKKFLQAFFLLAITASTVFINPAHAAPSKNSATNNDLVLIQDAWIRQTSAGQEVGAAYMTLSSTQNVTLIGVESDVTKSVEIHSMSMENGVMKMRMLDTLPLQANKPYKLAPGGFHLMLFDLKKPLKIGDQVNFVLRFNKTNGLNKKPVEFKQNVRATVTLPPDDSAKTPHH